VAKKVKVVLDDDTYRLLEELAHPRAGNKSFVVREALRYFADRETIERALDGILALRHAREAMEAGIEARNQERFLPHTSVIRGFAGSRKRGENRLDQTSWACLPHALQIRSIGDFGTPRRHFGVPRSVPS